VRAYKFILIGLGLFISLLITNIVDVSDRVQAQDSASSYPIVDTHQEYCFSATGVIPCGQSFDGQDAQYAGLQPAYQDNGDGTVTDLNTGLMWQQNPGEKVTYPQALERLETFTLAGYHDWRLPTIKELYSLMQFSGMDASAALSTDGLTPFINTDFFTFQYGNIANGERIIDSQWISSNVYTSTVFNGVQCFFGVNFADGRIKCYPLASPQQKSYFALFVRGNVYGENDFVDNGDGTITDRATGLIWMQDDNGVGVLWQDALNYCETLSLGRADDWRLPNIKELHSVVDYSRSPDATGSAALDPVFNTTSIMNEAGQPDYPFYWSSTTLMMYPDRVDEATYIAFGRALGYMEAMGGWLDVHGAGAQRSDPKLGVAPDEVLGHGPQGDARRAYNYVRCVRGGNVRPSAGEDSASFDLFPRGDRTTQPPSNDQNQNTIPRQPPEQAYAACNNLVDGASCSFQAPNGVVTGVCRPFEERLACVPD